MTYMHTILSPINLYLPPLLMQLQMLLLIIILFLLLLVFLSLAPAADPDPKSKLKSPTYRSNKRSSSSSRSPTFRTATLIPLYSQRGRSVCESRTNLRQSPTHAGEVSYFASFSQLYSAFPIIKSAARSAFCCLLALIIRPPTPTTAPAHYIFSAALVSTWAGLGMAGGMEGWE